MRVEGVSPFDFLPPPPEQRPPKDLTVRCRCGAWLFQEMGMTLGKGGFSGTSCPGCGLKRRWYDDGEYQEIDTRKIDFVVPSDLKVEAYNPDWVDRLLKDVRVSHDYHEDDEPTRDQGGSS